MTLKEYLEDYASAETKAIGNRLIEQELQNIPNEEVRERAKEYLEKEVNGERDFRF